MKNKTILLALALISSANAATTAATEPTMDSAPIVPSVAEYAWPAPGTSNIANTDLDSVMQNSFTRENFEIDGMDATVSSIDQATLAGNNALGHENIRDQRLITNDLVLNSKSVDNTTVNAVESITLNGTDISHDKSHVIKDLKSGSNMHIGIDPAAPAPAPAAPAAAAAE